MKSQRQLYYIKVVYSITMFKKEWIWMDVVKKDSKEKFVANKIRKIMAEGKPMKQAVAIALNMWKRKKGN